MKLDADILASAIGCQRSRAAVFVGLPASRLPAILGLLVLVGRLVSQSE